MGTRSQALRDFLKGFSDQEIFFGVWIAIVAFFVFLIMSYHKKTTRRNFRDHRDGPGPKIPVDARRLKDSNEEKGVSVKKGRVGIKNTYPKN